MTTKEQYKRKKLTDRQKEIINNSLFSFARSIDHKYNQYKNITNIK